MLLMFHPVYPSDHSKWSDGLTRGHAGV